METGRKGSSTAGGGPVCSAAPSPDRSVKSSTGGGPKSVVQTASAVPSGTPNPTSPSRTGGKGATQRSGSQTTAPRPTSRRPSLTLLTAPVELSTTFVAPVEQVAEKRKATSPLSPRQTNRPTNPKLPSRWGLAHSRIKGIFKDKPTSHLPLKTSLYFRLPVMVLLYAPSYRQDSTYHGLCYKHIYTLTHTYKKLYICL